LVLQSPVSGSALVGAKATITKHVVGGSLGSGAAAEIFLSETEATKVSGNTITTDNTGRWTQGESASPAYAQYWLPEGTYDILIFGTGLTAVYITRELASASHGIWEPGDLKLSAASAVAAGWLACEGQLVSTSTYAALYAAIGTAYGSGSGTFGLPDFRGRSPLGAGTGSGLTARSRGDKPGEETHVLSEGEMPSHTHTIPGNITITTLGGRGTNEGSNPGHEYGEAIFTSGTGPTGATGGGGAHNNMQPSTVCGVWIKT
jgi:microcystin-dependent protein